jgi:hypothetical protein
VVVTGQETNAHITSVATEERTFDVHGDLARLSTASITSVKNVVNCFVAHIAGTR